MKPGKLFRTKSLTKNWPGGRRIATVPVETLDKNDKVSVAYRLWNKRIVNIKAEWNDGVRTYLEPLPPPSQGGMAKPTEAPVSTATGNLGTNHEIHS